MPDLYRVKYDLQVYRKLEEIFEYIHQDSPQNVAKMLDRIITAVESLESFPHRYNIPRNVETLGRDIRSMPVRPFLIRYSIDETTKTERILDVRHGARRA